jgi:hypothetical protein
MANIPTVKLTTRIAAALTFFAPFMIPDFVFSLSYGVGWQVVRPWYGTRVANFGGTDVGTVV